MRPFESHLDRIPQADLEKIAAWLVCNAGTAPAFYAWLAEDIVGHERSRRGNSPDAAARHMHKLPSDWSDTQVAEALRASLELSYADNLSIEAGDLLDSIAIAVTAEAAKRLRERRPELSVERN